MLQLGLRNGDIIGIGSLEARILRALYECGDWMSVPEAVERVRQDVPLAYSSVITCLKRMADKGYLEAEKDDQGAWRFRPALPAHELALLLIQGIWENLFGPPPASLSRFVTDALVGNLGAEGIPEGAQALGRQTRDLAALIAAVSEGPAPADDEAEGPGQAAVSLPTALEGDANRR